MPRHALEMLRRPHLERQSDRPTEQPLHQIGSAKRQGQTPNRPPTDGPTGQGRPPLKRRPRAVHQHPGHFADVLFHGEVLVQVNNRVAHHAWVTDRGLNSHKGAGAIGVWPGSARFPPNFGHGCVDEDLTLGCVRKENVGGGGCSWPANMLVTLGMLSTEVGDMWPGIGPNSSEFGKDRT